MRRPGVDERKRGMCGPGLRLVVLGPLLVAAGCSGTTEEGARTAGDANSKIAGREGVAAMLSPSSKTVDLGIVPKAGRVEEVFSLTNSGTSPITVARVTTSCPCLSIELAREVVAPSETVLARAVLDLAHEADFEGGMAATVEGFTTSGAPAFNLTVDVTVRPAEQFRFGGGHLPDAGDGKNANDSTKGARFEGPGKVRNP